MRPLLGCWTEVRDRIRNAGSIILFADFDGTLAPFTLRHEDARLSRATRDVLSRLAARPGVQVRVISGRGLADLEQKVAASGVQCFGTHGWDHGNEQLPAEAQQRLSDARRKVTARLNGTSGLRLEDKGASFAVHYRGATLEAGQRAHRAIEEMLNRFGGSLTAIPGDCVWEVLPSEIRGKGYAARREWRLHAPGALPIYLGNDATDEPAFQALAEGITARVGRRGPTHARYLLRSPGEVQLFLERLYKLEGL